MKLLRNPIVVGTLVVISALVVAYQFKPGNRGAATPSAAAAVPVTPSAPAPVAPAPKPRVETVPPAAEAAEISALLADAEQWAVTPRRDPFRIRFYTPHVSGSTNLPHARTLLTLGAVWFQEISTLAVVNGAVLREGDTILEFRITKIEQGGIWVERPNQEAQEFVGFNLTATEEEKSAVNPFTAPSHALAPKSATLDNKNAP